MKPIASVIIPAHNEAAVIERCLASLLADASDDEFEVWVMCNGCTDDTANRVRRFGRGVNVDETGPSSKCSALNRGDEHAQTFPRIYLDADAELDTTAARKTVEALAVEGIHAAAPRPALALGPCSHAARAFFRAWLRSPYANSNLIGNGVYALDEEGRKRFSRFPELFAEDLWIQELFTSDERRALDNTTFALHPPRRLRELLNVRARMYYGNAELARREDLGFPNPANPKASVIGLARRTRSPQQAVDLVTYLAVNSLAKVIATRRIKNGAPRVWHKDSSSRVATES
jgi:glycosyltransferase involved in cell wall biosynthesis